MPVTTSASSVDSTGPLPQHIAGFDPTPAIAAQEQSLLDYLSLPTRDILAQLGLAGPPASVEPDRPGEPEAAEPTDQAGDAASPVDPMQLISPVMDALGTLGTGAFDNFDPTKVLGGVSEAVDAAAQSVSPAIGSLAQDWQGESGAAAARSAGAALANGAEVSTQASGLRGSLMTAAATVAQAKARHIEIISQFQATIAAIGPSIAFPWGWAAAVAAASQAVTASVEVITETQATLGAEAAATSAIGAPVSVAAAPALGSAMAGPLSQLATGMGPLTQLATGMIGPLTSLAGQASKAASQQPTSATDDAGAPPLAWMAGAGSPGAAGGGGGGFGPAGTPTAKALPPLSQAPAPVSTAAATPTSAARTPMVPMAMGAPMMGAPMAGAGVAGGGAVTDHNAAAFLHTSDQGGDIVGDLGTVAPPVIGEADPHESTDIELRI
jgi:hypothetical protein